MCCGDPVRDLVDQLAQRLAVLGLQRAQRHARARARRDHVLGAPALEHADVHNGRMQRIDSPRRLRIQRERDLRDRQDRVAP